MSKLSEDAKKFLSKKTNPVDVVAYDRKGGGVDPQSHGCVARVSIHEKTGLEKYEVRVCTRGLDTGLFYNPATHHHDDLIRFDSHTGKMRFSWREVGKEAFENYVDFLKTGNAALLRLAQRA